MGGGMIRPEGFVIMNVRVPCVRGYNEDQIAIVLEDPEMKDCPVVLGTPTLFRRNGGDQGKRNKRVSRAMGQLETLLADEGCTR